MDLDHDVCPACGRSYEEPCGGMGPRPVDLDQMTDRELARVAVFEPESFIHLEPAEQPALDWTVYADPNPFPRIRLLGRCRRRG